MKTKSANKGKLKTPKLSFTVKLNKWRCGNTEFSEKYDPTNEFQKSIGIGDTALLNDKGYKCCLGFFCQQSGYKGALTDLCEPQELDKFLPGLNEISEYNRSYYNSEFSQKAMKINDCGLTTIAEKMKLLIELGKKYKIKIKFE